MMSFKVCVSAGSPSPSMTLATSAAESHVVSMTMWSSVRCSESISGMARRTPSGGALGSGTFASSTVPVPVSGLAGAVGITVGDSHSCALVAGRRTECWGQNTFGQDQDDVIMIPLTTAKRKVLGITQANARSVNGISVKVADGEDLKEVEQNIRDLIRQRHRLQPGQDDDFGIRSAAEMVQTRDEQAQLMTKLLMSIASVSLLVGGIGIMNIMLVSVTERTREIGLRMAVGARGRDILTQFLVEALTVALIGGSIGVVAGLGASFALAYFGEWRTVISPSAILLAFTFSGLIGMFFGFYPARKAAGLNPIDALRYE